MLAADEFERYYRDLRPGLLRFVSSRVRDIHAARDLVQEIYAKAFRSLDRYDEKRPFATWIYAIARNSCIDYLRRRVRDPWRHRRAAGCHSRSAGRPAPR